MSLREVRRRCIPPITKADVIMGSIIGGSISLIIILLTLEGYI